jgi:predicted transcriptional regulator
MKAQIVKHIFKDLGPKNLKGVEYFYAICSNEEMNLQFMSSAKDILITIILKRNLFQHYLYSKERPSLLKYALEDFTPLAALFENNKQLLDLVINEESWTLSLVGGSGRTQFVASALSCDQDDE